MNFSKLFLTLHKHITNYIYFQRLVKTFNEGANPKQPIDLGFSKKQSVENPKQPIDLV